MDVSLLSNAELREALIEYNVYSSPPPVVDSTRPMMERKLMRVMGDQGTQMSTGDTPSPKKTPQKSPKKASPRVKAVDYEDDSYYGEESYCKSDVSSPHLYPSLSESPYMKALYNRKSEVGVMSTPSGGRSFVTVKGNKRKRWDGMATGWPRTIIFGMFFVFVVVLLYMFGTRLVKEFAPDFDLHAFAAPFYEQKAGGDDAFE